MFLWETPQDSVNIWMSNSGLSSCQFLAIFSTVEANIVPSPYSLAHTSGHSDKSSVVYFIWDMVRIPVLYRILSGTAGTSNFAQMSCTSDKKPAPLARPWTQPETSSRYLPSSPRVYCLVGVFANTWFAAAWQDLLPTCVCGHMATRQGQDAVILEMSFVRSSGAGKTSLRSARKPDAQEGSREAEPPCTGDIHTHWPMFFCCHSGPNSDMQRCATAAPIE
mmetsp:Transcript_43835/g.115798  ORF Transcript_43835/g.115798 Transcript_43835/m.115798 type:complete len:221 (-) Transcript_43835:53-715(-)